MTPTPPDDAPGLRDTIDRYERPLIAYALRIVGRVENAREVVQETFLQLCRSRPHELNGNLQAWLYTVCRNKALDAKRKEGRMTQLDDAAVAEFTSTVPEPPESAERSESTAGIVRLLATLPPNQQEAIRLKFQHGLSYREIAAVTQLSESNVGFLISTGLKTIREKCVT
ncbi:MAG TPA: sigma-70 family RNA polymerase sigma factor [Tepidisphaeraceae bacterium]|jgi:RNA polymerase sigma-70 factor (ECF subfamily)|nr:sigma-70 family RNA polymerase sigma factor [Tepidisphaeraceae bacterium]